MQERGTRKFIKVGDFYAVQFTKQDKSILGVQPGDDFEMEISPDGETITLRKKHEIAPEKMKLIERIFNEEIELMKRLKDK